MTKNPRRDFPKSNEVVKNIVNKKSIRKILFISIVIGGIVKKIYPELIHNNKVTINVGK